MISVGLAKEAVGVITAAFRAGKRRTLSVVFETQGLGGSGEKVGSDGDFKRICAAL